jgi:hypothetical protein
MIGRIGDAFSEKRPKNGAPVGIRTQDPLLRRQMLYPTELRAQPLIIKHLQRNKREGIDNLILPCDT